MRKIIILVLATMFIAASCNKPTSSIKKDTEVASDSDLFAKKAECAKHQNEIEQNLEKQHFVNPQTKAEFFSGLKKVFYSPKKNSCLYVEEEWFIINNKRDSTTLRLVDYFTKELLIVVSIPNDITPQESLSKKEYFEEMILEYEN